MSVAKNNGYDSLFDVEGIDAWTILAEDTFPKLKKGIDGFSKAFTQAGGGFKGFFSGIGAFLEATPALSATLAAGIGVTLGVLAAKIPTAAEAANNAMEKASASYDTAKKEAEGVNSELDSMKSRMDELQAQGGLTFVEQSELQNLKEATDLLRIQAALRNDEKIEAAKKLSESTSNAYRKNFENRINDENVSYWRDYFDQNKEEIGYSSFDIFGDYTDRSRVLAGIQFFKNVKEEQGLIGKDAAVIDGMINEAEGYLKTDLSMLAGYVEAFNSLPDEVKPDQSVFTDLNSDLDYLFSSVMPGQYAQNKFDEIFDDKAIRDAKDELVKFTKEANKPIDADAVIAAIPNIEQILSEKGFTVNDLVNQINSEAGVVKRSVAMRQLDKAFNARTGSEAADFQNWLSGLSDEEFALVYDIYLKEDTSGFTLDDWMAKIKQSKELAEEPVEVKSLEKYKESVDNTIAAQSNLTAAFSASNSATGLNAEQIDNVTAAFKDLENFDMNALFETTQNGVRLNTEAFRAYSAELERQTKSKFMKDIIDKQKEFNEALEESGGDLDDANVKRLAEELRMFELLANQYDAATSKYNKFIEASSSANARDSFENVAKGYQGVKDLLDQGWTTADDVTSYLDLVLGENWRSDFKGDSKAAFDSLTTGMNAAGRALKDYMTFDENGNFTSKGAWQFVEDVASTLGDSFASMADGTKYLDLTGEKLGIVAREFGTTTEFVELMARALADAGWDVKFDSDDIKSYNNEMKRLSEESAKSQEELKKLKESAKDGFLSDVSLDYDSATMSMDELDAKIDELNGEIVKIEASADTKDAKQNLDALEKEKKLLTKKKIMLAIETELLGGTSIDDLLSIEDDPTLAAKLNLDISDVAAARKELESLKNNGDVDVPVKVMLDEGQLAQLTSSTGVANFELGEYPETVPDATGVVNYTGVFPTSAPPIKGTIVYGASASVSKGTSTFGSILAGLGKSSGTMLSVAHSDGTAYNVLNYKRLSPSYAGGKVSLDKDEFALTNEEGLESIIRNGEWFLLPPGPHMEHLKKGDIIFNAQQTRDLLKFGKTTSYGKAYASGTVGDWGGVFANVVKNSTSASTSIAKELVSGVIDKIEQVVEKTTSGLRAETALDNPWGKDSGSSGSGSGGGGGGSESSEEAEKNLEKIDWIEVAIDRIERSIKKLNDVASSAFETLDTRTSATRDSIAKINQEIKTQLDAQKRYLEEANTIGLDDSIKKLIQEGTIDIREYDEEQRDLISQYQNWYEKSLDAAEAVRSLHSDIAQLYQDSFDMAQSDAENRVSLIEHSITELENRMDYAKESGYMSATSIYSSLINTEMQRMNLLKGEYSTLQQKLRDAIASGEIKEGSEAFYEMKIAINDVKESIDESNLAMLKYSNAIRDTKWEFFDYAQERISKLTEETEFLVDLIGDNKLFSDDGSLTKDGLASAALYAQAYNTYMAQADAYAKEVKNINAELAKDPNNTVLIKRKEDLIKAQQQSILAAEKEKKAMVDLTSDGIKAQLDAMKDLISKYKESIDKAKSLYDYQKNISKQSKKVADIEKQIAAYSNNDSEESRAKLQKLRTQLQDAQDSLQETEYDKYVSDQKELLDGLSKDFEDVINERLDNVDQLFAEMIETVNANAVSAKDAIDSAARDVGYTLSASMSTIWDTNSRSIIDAVSVYGNNFTNLMTGTNAALNSIYSRVSAMASASERLVGITSDYADVISSADVSSMNFGSVAMTGIGGSSAGFTANSSPAGGVSIGNMSVTIPIDHVEDYEDLVTHMRNDKTLERFIQSITTNLIAGGSSLDKYNYTWK